MDIHTQINSSNNTSTSTTTTSANEFVERVKALDWKQILQDLNAHGNAIMGNLICSADCDALSNLYQEERIFRSTVIMEKHGFGLGEYKYFKYPLPTIIDVLRTTIYPYLVPVANSWNEAMGIDVRYPEKHPDFVARCHVAGQLKPTALLLQYDKDGYNCLHQDVYGQQIFPLQVTILLSKPERDFTGGEFVLTEQRPRMQSRPEVVPLRQGDAVIFAVHNRPAYGTRGIYRVNHRHGVSRVRSGRRYALGIIFHDAK
jgi:hypothetical protein